MFSSVLSSNISSHFSNKENERLMSPKKISLRIITLDVYEDSLTEFRKRLKKSFRLPKADETKVTTLNNCAREYTGFYYYLVFKQLLAGSPDTIKFVDSVASSIEILSSSILFAVNVNI